VFIKIKVVNQML